MKYGQILKNVSTHITLDQEEKEFFISLLRERIFKRKEFVLREGEVARSTNYVVRGCLRLYRVDEKGVIHTGFFSIEDYWITDLYSFLTQTPATTNIDTLEDTLIFQISKDDMEKLYTHVPKFERLFRIMHQRAFIAQQKRIMKNISTTAEEQYLQFKAKYPGLESRIPQKEIAAYLGITPEFLSMMKRKMLNKKKQSP
jgi:CRP-like cAMP-binding protein